MKRCVRCRCWFNNCSSSLRTASWALLRAVTSIADTDHTLQATARVVAVGRRDLQRDTPVTLRGQPDLHADDVAQFQLTPQFRKSPAEGSSCKKEVPPVPPQRLFFPIAGDTRRRIVQIGDRSVGQQFEEHRPTSERSTAGNGLRIPPALPARAAGEIGVSLDGLMTAST